MFKDLRRFGVGTGLVLQGESFWMDPHPYHDKDSHPAIGGIPAIDDRSMVQTSRTPFQLPIKE